MDVWVYKIYENNVFQFLQYNNINSTDRLRDVGRPVGRKIIDLKSTGKEISKWNTFSLNLREIIEPDAGAIYRVEFKTRYEYSAYTCAGGSPIVEMQDQPMDFDSSLETSNWDGADNYYYYEDYDYDYNWRDREDPCTPSFYRNKSTSTNVLASDLGVIVKKGTNNTYTVAVSSIVNTQPIGGALVQLFNYQQQEIASARTNLAGMVEFKNDKVAFFAKISHSNQANYIRLDDGNSLPMSKFDTSGKQLENGIKGYVYGERGVWRPGDPMYLTFVLNDTDNKLPAGHPVNLKLNDPNGKLIHTETQKLGLNNFYLFELKTDQDAITGNYSAAIEVGGITFNKTLKIENVKPNRLKINLDFKDEVIKSKKKSPVAINAAWLHGATAKSLKADVNVRLFPTTTTFDNYSSYTFDDPGKFLDLQEQEVFNGKLDASGNASFVFEPQINGEAPGMLKANFLTKVYENGGDFSTQVSSKTYSPYETYVGLDVPPGDKQRGMLLTDEDHKMDVVTVDQFGKPQKAEQLEVKVYKVEWRWWWQSQSGSLSRYEARDYRQLVHNEVISTDTSGKGSFKFSLKYPEWGRYYVRVYNPASGHSTGKIVYVDWPGWAGKSKNLDPEIASILVFNADKETYKVGAKAQISFPSTSGGRALVSIENGTEVLQTEWVDTQDKKTNVSIDITDRFVPNVFVNITYLQPHAQTANDLPIRMYGVIPIAVENENTHLKPEIKMPETLRPDSEVNITVSEKNNRKMTYTIAVVDEGLLDLTNFSTPDAWESFFAKEALGVKTWDVYDDVIGAYGGRIDAAFAIGGDGSANAAKAKKANRFKPMVIHLGPFQLEKGARKTHKIKIPQYVGSVRTMVVAGNSGSEAYGSAEKTTPVKKPLMMLASLPRKLTPGEQFKLPVTIFAMDKKVNDVTITLQESEFFKIVSSSEQRLEFTETGDKIAYFELRVKEKLGIARLDLKATAAGVDSAVYGTEIDVVNPNPFTTYSKRRELPDNESTTIVLEPFGVSGSNSASLTFSTMPPLDLGRRLNYLIRYPHGCVEQVTSGAFPQLHLSQITDLNSEQEKNISQNVKAAIQRLNGFQQPNGGLSYWPGYGNANDWGTTYAGHFMIDAEKMGYTIPISFKSNWIKYQKRAAKEWRFDRNNDLMQAYRLYTLALAGAPDLSSMNRFRESGTLSNNSKLRLAAAYAIVGQKNAARELIKNSNIDFQPAQSDYRTYGSPQRNRAMALETFVILGDETQARDLIETIAKDLNSDNSYNTQAVAYSLIAASQYASFKAGKDLVLEYSVAGKNYKVNTKKPIFHKDIALDNEAINVVIGNNSRTVVFVNYATTGKLPVGKELVVESNLKAVTVYTDRSGKVIDVGNLQQGTEIIATTTVSNSTGLAVKDLAFTQFLPSGWEIVNTRFTDYGDQNSNAAFDYVDIKDDRVHYYFDLPSRGKQVIKTIMNASYLGSYYLPGIQCEAMYDEDYVVRNKGKWIEVVR